jgi:3-hydroxybutyryl-CoA dehydrogenase
MDTVKTVGVIGAGTMGNGIAQACATSGVERGDGRRRRRGARQGARGDRGSLERLVKKEKLSATDRDAALARVRTTTRYEELAASTS